MKAMCETWGSSHSKIKLKGHRIKWLTQHLSRKQKVIINKLILHSFLTLNFTPKSLMSYENLFQCQIWNLRNFIVKWTHLSRIPSIPQTTQWALKNLWYVFISLKCLKYISPMRLTKINTSCTLLPFFKTSSLQIKL